MSAKSDIAALRAERDAAIARAEQAEADCRVLCQEIGRLNTIKSALPNVDQLLVKYGECNAP